MSKLRVFEAFAGIGCQTIALRNLGIDFECVGISEVDRYALLGYDAIHNDEDYYITDVSINEMVDEMKKAHIAYNFSTNTSQMPKKINDIIALYKAHTRNNNFGDIRLIDVDKLPDFDLFTFSPPCKNISVEGKQDSLKEGSETQSSLIWECCRIIEAKRPKYLLFENVKNILANKHKPHFDRFCKLLESYGYVNHYGILNALNFGVPQNRERCMMFSVLKEYDKGLDLPKGERTSKKIFDVIEKDNHEYDLKGKERNNFLTTITVVDGKLRVPNGTKQGYLDMKLPGVFDFNRPYSTTRRGRVKEDGEITSTITASEGNDLYVQWKDNAIYPRRLTSLELWRLMGHSDEDYYKCKNVMSDRYLRERAGRSIVIPMLEEIFKIYLMEV